MHLGIFLSITESTIRIDELACEVEARGFESLWVTEHTHVPVRRRMPLPPYLRARGAGDELPQHLSHLFDPFITLMAAAAVTQTLKLGTGTVSLSSVTPS
jgi:alkanesulfonate monooxygenase SsuD/methylene tetrahydromethanopterin reductase-like flavin-dependent oxidoreductase (luciferase family)